jgi:hypothetical protein
MPKFELNGRAYYFEATDKSSKCGRIEMRHVHREKPFSPGTRLKYIPGTNSSTMESAD